MVTRAVRIRQEKTETGLCGSTGSVAKLDSCSTAAPGCAKSKDTHEFGQPPSSSRRLHPNSLTRQGRSGFKRKEAHTAAGDGPPIGISHRGFPDLCATAAGQRAGGGAEPALAHR